MEAIPGLAALFPQRNGGSTTKAGIGRGPLRKARRERKTVAGSEDGFFNRKQSICGQIPAG